MGVAYKRDMGDVRESPALVLLRLLSEVGAVASYSDPFVPSLPPSGGLPELRSQPLRAEFIASNDCIVIATDHTAVNYASLIRHASLIVDTRNVIHSPPECCVSVVRA